ncbi:hotdog fold thioesterase [Legionella maioricensis]|uniref:Hotdog fold thioesterase n=1 Tax=Legionella maioricensis TaxID=2896528 RepID=A0A9X2D1U0_9GAMM|nr:hotdog fold thioesterase [Legionella maioricensis]MCL9684926.1 hotdog fold thioesterase [Legionella maioricensis]MCL9688242.1 hotdog fold thioesterase [Legionella maioricensis]
MAIWFREISIEELNRIGKNTMVEFLGIQFTEVGEDFLSATMPVNDRTKQPIGILHGGANMALAETVASMAANAVIDPNQFYCVGLEINANHIRSVREGLVRAVTSPIHLGRTTQIWQIDIFNEAGKKTCISRMTASVLNR